MKKILFLILLAMTPFVSKADSYSSLWKKVNEAESKDLPKTELEWLGKIIEKAEGAQDYGHLLKAQLMSAKVKTTLSPDSLEVEIERLEAKQKAATSAGLKAVYACAIAKTYQGLDGRDSRESEKMNEWFKTALADPDALAHEKSTGYTPAFLTGQDSKIFYDDLLHVIGIEANDFDTLYKYYSTHGNRPADCICALKVLEKQNKGNETVARRSRYLQRIDSLITVYGDLREAGEIAIARYQFISNCEDVTAEDRYNYINYALSRWGAWPRMNVLRNAQSELQQPEFNINIGDCMLLPNTERLVRINSIRNINELTVNVYRVRLNGDTELDPSDPKDYDKIKSLIFPGEVQSVTKRYLGQPTWKENQDSIYLKPLPIGVYLIEATTDNQSIQPQRQLLRVTDLYVIRQPLPGKKIRFVVVSATTGKPVSDAHIKIYDEKYRYTNYRAAKAGQSGNSQSGEKEEGVLAIGTTGKNGEAIYEYKDVVPRRVYPYTSTDKACGITYAGNAYYYHDSKTDQPNVSLLTDRSIYRPGQTVHVTAICFTKNDAQLKAVPLQGKNVVFTLRDANYKEVKKLNAVTDEYGTAAVDFALPAAGLTGRYVVRTDNGGYAGFNVEQYKRPTFDVEIEKYKQAYQAGDTVKLKGTAKMYSGIPVQGARVEYRVVCRPAFWFYWGREYKESEVVSDSTTTASDGSFTMRVPMDFPINADVTRPLYYKMDVSAKVTDASGETHEGTFSLPLSNRNSILSTDLNAKVLRDSLKTITITRQNAAGEMIDGNVSYRFDNGNWAMTAANKPFAINTKLASGQHHLEAVCQGDTLKKDFVVFSMQDKKPAVETHDWFYISDNSFRRDGKPVYLQVGTSDEDVTMYYAAFSGNRILAQGHKTLSNEVYTHKLNYEPEDGNGVTISLAWVRHGKLYSHQVRLARPVPDNRLLLTWKTFRDRLTPGQKEVWTLNVSRPDGKPATAQVLAAMYDKSLDQILKHRWNFGYQYYSPLPSAFWAGGCDDAIGLYGFEEMKRINENSLDFTHFDPSLFSFSLLQHGMVQEVRMFSRAKTLGATPSVKANAATGMVAVAGNAEAADMANAAPSPMANPEAANGEETKAEESTPSLRENFEETAFCYPQLLSNKNGLVDIKFTLPESVTTWHFMGLAHDKDMNYGSLESNIVAKKTVMIQPNLPRFIRQGDRTSFASRIANTSERKVSGTARITFINPDNDQTVYELSSPFTIDAGQTTTVDFMIDSRQLTGLADNTSLYRVRITAEGRGFSDGEQHWMPLLPSEELVTTTVPFTQDGPGKKTIELGKLFPKADKRNRLTVEYANHPAWLMVQALPTVANPYEKDAISLAAAIYANSLAHQIITASPTIAKTLQQWEQETGKETSLMSSLQKNEELKTIVLSETPWVADADRESTQKQMLTGYLNASNVDYRLTQFASQLSKLQNADGSFSWWPGMQGNPYVTLSVAEILSRLKAMSGSLSNDLNNLMRSATGYLDKQLAKEVTELKKLEKKGTKHLAPSESACHYLYVNALNHRKSNADIAYMVGLLEKMPTQLTIYGKAGSAIVLSEYGKDNTAREYLQSIKEYTVYKEGMGRYFDTPRAQYSWCDYRIPSQVFAIEALQRLTPQDTVTIEEMQRWLLQEKHTQAWDTPINSVNAVHAFLADAQGKVDMSKLGQGENTRLSIDGKTLRTSKATAGLGYVKQTVDSPDNANTFTAEKTSEGTSWGALYAQFWQPATEVKNAASGLKITRELVSPTTHKPIAKGTQLRMGDKVAVRITITADRDYDFVQVQDKRAACLEPVNQTSGYRWGYYYAPQDNVTNLYFDRMAKGKHVVDIDYYLDREGDYQSGICTVQCAYSPEFSGREAAKTIVVKQ
jgi:uncharacterized protein YfaS (alpha-2-macroglobulin family)